MPGFSANATRKFFQVTNFETLDDLQVLAFQNEDIANGSFETMWNHDGLYPWLAVPSPLTISSTSTLDTAAGTGAQEVVVSVLDRQFKQVDEVIELNGQTPVPFTTNGGILYRVNGMVVNRVGATGANQGILYVGTGTVTTGVPATVLSLVDAGDNLSRVGIFTVPYGKLAFLDTGLFAADGRQVFYRVIVRSEVNGVAYTVFQMAILDGTDEVHVGSSIGLIVGTDLEVQGLGDGVAASGFGQIRLGVVDDD